MPYGVDPAKIESRRKSIFDVLTPQEEWHPPMKAPAGSDFASMLQRNFMPQRHDAEMLAKTALGEARGEGDEGMRAVMHTVMNRLNTLPHGARIEDVVLAPGQFSAWNAGNPNREFMEEASLEENENLINMAEKVIAKADKDPTGGATHYYAPDHVNEPSWAEKMEKTATVGGHEFFKERKRKKIRS